MAEKVEYNLNLDLTLHPIQSILIKQYSKNVYKLIVSVTKETVVYVLNDSLYNVYFKMRTPDNRYVYTQGSIDENGKILLDVPESAAWTAGVGEAEFEIIKKDGTSRMSTCSFEVVIDASSYEEAEITGSEDFSALVDYISQAADISDEVAQAKEYRDEAVTSATTASQAAQTATTAESTVRGLQESAAASATVAVESKESAEASATTASQAAQSASEDAEAISQALQEAIALYNGPLTAKTAAEMTQTNRIYVYTGSESGYTFGNWYYYNGSTWQSGGTYNATAMDLDDTLTVEGKAADAKAVGDEIESFRSYSTNKFSNLEMTDDSIREDVTSLKEDLRQITNYGQRIVNDNDLEHYWVNNGILGANADSLMGIVQMQQGEKYVVSANGQHNRFRIYVSNTIEDGTRPTEVYRSEPVHTVTGDTYEYTNTDGYKYLLCFMNYLTEQSMTFSVKESFGDETEPFEVNGIVLYTKEQTNEAIENAVEGITPYRNIFDGVYVSQYPGTGGVIVDTDSARSARFNVKPNYTYHIHAVGNTNRFIVYGGQNGVFTEITRIQTADVTGDDKLSVTNTNYTEFLVVLYFGTSGSSFACSTTVFESQTAELHFSVNGTQVYTAEETDELLNALKAETSEEIRENSSDKYVYSKNLYDITESVAGYSIASATGELVELPSARASSFIEIFPNTKYTFSTKHVVAWYDENKVFVSGVPSSDTNLTLTSPANAKYLRFSHNIIYDEVMVNEGETALPYQPYDVCLQPEYLPPIKKYALDFGTVKYTAGITAGMNNLLLMAYKMEFGTFPNYQGFLLLDGIDNKFYFVDSNMQNIEHVFDWNLTLANNVGPQDYLYTITAEGDVICLRRWKRENPIIYPHTDYTAPVRVDFGNNPAPYGFLESISCVQFDDGSFVFGEYAKHSLTDEQNNDRRNIWRVTKPYTNVANWTIAHSFKHVFYESPVSDEPDNEIGHIHTVVYDFYADILYCSTGDIDRHCRVWASEDKGITWAEVASNGQKYRALGMTFTDDSAYWATDSFNARHNLWKVDRDANGELDFDTLTMLCSLEPSSRRSGSQATTGSQATYGMILMREPYGILMLERAEPRSDNKLDILFYSLENEKLYTVATLGKADDLASLVEPNRNGLCNQCFTDYQPDTCDYALTGGGQMVRPNTTDVLHNSETNYIGVLRLRVVEKVNQ